MNWKGFGNWGGLHKRNHLIAEIFVIERGDFIMENYWVKFVFGIGEDFMREIIASMSFWEFERIPLIRGGRNWGEFQNENR